MSDVINRLSLYDLEGSHIVETSPAEVLGKMFELYELNSTRETIISTLAEYNYCFGLDDPERMKQFLECQNQNLFRADNKRFKKKFGLFTILTRPNLLFLLKRLLSADAIRLFGKQRVTNINQLNRFLLKLNCFDDGATDPGVSHDFNNEETILKLMTVFFRYNFLAQKTQLSLADLLRNYKLIKTISNSDHGRIASQLFYDQFGLQVDEVIELGFLIYMFITSKYHEGDYSNRFNFETSGFTKAHTETYIKLRSFLFMMSDPKPYSFGSNESLYDFYRIWEAPVLRYSETHFQMLDLGLLVEKTLLYPFIFF